MGNFMQSAVSLKGKLKSACNYVKTYWDKAPANRYLSFKEAAAYCIGGIGINAATMVPTYLTLTYGMYVAAALGISNDIIMWVGIITSVITILRSPFISYLVDNTNTKYGKFRPYLIWMPVPCTILIALMGWTPTIMSGASQIAIIAVYTVMFNLMQFFMQLYTLAFTSIMQVISPSPEERTVIMSVGTTVYSLGPTIINALFPLLANMIFTVKGGGGLSEDGVAQDLLGVNTMGPYEWILPVMTVAFFAIGYITVFGVKERMVLPRKKKMRVPFFKGVSRRHAKEQVRYACERKRHFGRVQSNNLFLHKLGMYLHDNFKMVADDCADDYSDGVHSRYVACTDTYKEIRQKESDTFQQFCMRLFYRNNVRHYVCGRRG